VVGFGLLFFLYFNFWKLVTFLTEEGELTVTVDTWKKIVEGGMMWKNMIGLVRKLRHRPGFHDNLYVSHVSFSELPIKSVFVFSGDIPNLPS